ncbi:PREDICTED: nuclear protein localization protein 4 homolog [Propithecus coquereli]|uniref:nuclear protein localization protein 4 homolog n=1 Tax=Propithecus coquereli TaxID=379532 RepID=UPI00063FA958|nr:PREDICTED: nuclear protein localization protein 4 homolog [Propithecus coquereli]
MRGPSRRRNLVFRLRLERRWRRRGEAGAEAGAGAARPTGRQAAAARGSIPEAGAAAMAESIIIRVQSPDGVKRITATKRETAATFLKKVAKEFGFQNNGFSVYINRNKTGEITASSNKSLNLLKVK